MVCGGLVEVTPSSHLPCDAPGITSLLPFFGLQAAKQAAVARGERRVDATDADPDWRWWPESLTRDNPFQVRFPTRNRMQHDSWSVGSAPMMRVAVSTRQPDAPPLLGAHDAGRDPHDRQRRRPPAAGHQQGHGARHERHADRSKPEHHYCRCVGCGHTAT